MAKLPNYHLQTEFRLEPPLGRSKSYRLRYKSPDTDNKWVALDHPDIDAANKLLKADPSLLAHTFDKLKIILDAQYVHRDRRKKKAVFMEKNLELVEAMWKDKYNRRKLRNMKRPERSKLDLLSAAEACGMHPLDTCDLDELADYLDKNLGATPNRLARRITWINSILQWLGRNKLQAVTRVGAKVCYLNEVEFKAVADRLKNPTTKRLARIAFYTGARIGEIFFIQERHIKGDTLLLELQMTDILLNDDSFKESTLKNGHSREVFLHESIKKDLLVWAKTPMAERYKIRKKAFSKLIYRACVAEFTTADPVKLLSFHDLRHSHAIWLIQAGATITETAQQLGNSPEVCYKYYSGHELKKESVERLKRLMTKTAKD